MCWFSTTITAKQPLISCLIGYVACYVTLTSHQSVSVKHLNYPIGCKSLRVITGFDACYIFPCDFTLPQSLKSRFGYVVKAGILPFLHKINQNVSLTWKFEIKQSSRDSQIRKGQWTQGVIGRWYDVWSKEKSSEKYKQLGLSLFLHEWCAC